MEFSNFKMQVKISYSKFRISHLPYIAHTPIEWIRRRVGALLGGQGGPTANAVSLHQRMQPY